MTHPYPLIGIPCRPDTTTGIYPGRPINVQSDSYINTVLQAGGLPILIPAQIQEEYLETLFRRVDGLIFSSQAGERIDVKKAPVTEILSGGAPERKPIILALE